MERNVDKKMETLINSQGVSGCILTDKSGLSLGVKGNASGDSAGLIAAIAIQAAQLDSELDPPVISLQNNSRQCIIRQLGPVIGAVFKDTSQ